MDKLELNGMRFYGYHGVFPEENRLGQRFIVDLQIYTDLTEPARTDDLADTISYPDIYHLTKQIVEGKPFQLVEALTEHIAQKLLATYTKINAVTVRVTKPNPPFDAHFDGVVVEMHRKREHYA